MTRSPLQRLPRPLVLLLVCQLGLASAARGQTEQLSDPDDADDWGEAKKKKAAPKAGVGPGGEQLSDPADTDDWGDKPSSQPSIVEEKVAKGGGDETIESPVHWGWDATLRLGLDPRYSVDRDGNSEDMMSLRGLATARLQYKPRKGIRLEMTAQLIYRLAMRRAPQDEGHFGHLSRNNLEPRIQDTFVELTTSWVDVTIGMVTTVWGASSLVNPNDQLTVQDLRDGPTLDPDDLRIPSPQLKLEAYLKDLKLSLVWLPGFKPNRVDMFGSDYSFFGPGAALVKVGTILEDLVNNSIEGQIQDSLLHSQMPRMINGSILGARASISLGGFDLAAQYTYALTRTPVYELRQDFVAGVLPLLQQPYVTLTPQDLRAFETMLQLSDPCPVPERCGRPIESSFKRYHQAGLSITKPIWKLVATLDVSYIHRQPLTLGGPTPFLNDEAGWFSTSLRSRVVNSTLGLQYTYGETAQVTVEGWHQLQLDYLSWDKANRPPLLRGGPNTAGVALLARFTWSKAHLVFELAAYTEIIYPGFTLIPQITYKAGDHLHLFVGANIFDGKEGSLLDGDDLGSSTGNLLDPNDQIYVGITAFL
jgi:hypothetical protein